MGIPKRYTYGPDKPGFVDYYLAEEVDELLKEVGNSILHIKDDRVSKVVDKIKKTLEQQ